MSDHINELSDPKRLQALLDEINGAKQAVERLLEFNQLVNDQVTALFEQAKITNERLAEVLPRVQAVLDYHEDGRSRWN